MFVYGSLLNPEELKRYNITPSRCRPAIIHGYRIVFDKRSRRRCAAANLKECINDKCEAVGIVCDTDDETIKYLDAREKGYYKASITCSILERERDSSIEVDAYIYISYERLSNSEVKKCISDPRFAKYLEIIAEGVIYWNKILPSFRERYLRGISKDPTHLIIADKLEELTSR